MISSEVLCVSSGVKLPNKGDKGAVSSPVVVSPSYFEVLKSSAAIGHSSPVEQVSRTSLSMLIHNLVGEKQMENDIVALRRSAHF